MQRRSGVPCGTNYHFNQQPWIREPDLAARAGHPYATARETESRPRLCRPTRAQVVRHPRRSTPAAQCPANGATRSPAFSEKAQQQGINRSRRAQLKDLSFVSVAAINAACYSIGMNSLRIDNGTPDLAVFDPRGLAVCAVAYCRSVAGQPVFFLPARCPRFHS